MRPLLIVLGLTTVLLAGCAQAPPPVEEDYSEEEPLDEHTQQIVQLLRTGDSTAKQMAIFKILEGSNPPPQAALMALIDTLRDIDPKVRLSAAFALGLVDPSEEEIYHPLAQATKDLEWRVRLQAVQSLGFLGPAAEPAVAALIEVLVRDRDPEVRKAAAIALGKIGSEDALPFLANVEYREGDEDVRVAAFEAIKRIKNQ